MVSNFDPLQAVCAPDTTGDLSPESVGQVHAGHILQSNGAGDPLWRQGVYEEHISTRQ